MRWIKHLTDAHLDEKLRSLIAHFGMEGYGVFWYVLEMVALSMRGSNKNYAIYPLKFWAKSCGIYPEKFRKIIGFLSVLKVFSINFSENDGIENLEVKVNNLLKYRDEYSERKAKIVIEKSGQNPDTVGIKSLQETESEIDTELNTDTERRKNKKEKLKEKSLSPKGEFDFLLSLFPDDWKSNIQFKTAIEEYFDHRRQLRKKMTKPACQKIVIKLTKYPIGTVILALNESVANGWTGVFPESVKLAALNEADGLHLSAKERSTKAAMEYLLSKEETEDGTERKKGLFEADDNVSSGI